MLGSLCGRFVAVRWPPVVDCIAPAQRCAIQAGVVTMNFSVSGFGAGAPIEELLSINLTINGHTHGLSEVGFDGFIIGGRPSSVSSVNAVANANDFLTSVDPVGDLSTLTFFHGAQGITNQIWFATGSLDMSYRETDSVPEPGTLALVALAMLEDFGTRRQKQWLVMVPARSRSQG